MNIDWAKIASIAAIVFGAALIWVPPAQLAGQTATVGIAFSFITGGFAGLGVSVTLPAVAENARRRGAAEGDLRRSGTDVSRRAP